MHLASSTSKGSHKSNHARPHKGPILNPLLKPLGGRTTSSRPAHGSFLSRGLYRGHAAASHIRWPALQDLTRSTAAVFHTGSVPAVPEAAGGPPSTTCPLLVMARKRTATAEFAEANDQPSLRLTCYRLGRIRRLPSSSVSLAVTSVARVHRQATACPLFTRLLNASFQDSWGPNSPFHPEVGPGVARRIRNDPTHRYAHTHRTKHTHILGHVDTDTRVTPLTACLACTGAALVALSTLPGCNTKNAEGLLAGASSSALVFFSSSWSVPPS